jgi:hypothetical protein
MVTTVLIFVSLLKDWERGAASWNQAIPSVSKSLFEPWACCRMRHLIEEGVAHRTERFAQT